MEAILFQEKYPIIKLEVKKDETSFKNISEVMQFFSEKINTHPKAKYIAMFDHYAHTKSLDGGEINPNIKEAQNIIFCFGVKLPSPDVMGVRPRSIGVCEFEDKFVISFMQAPVPEANEAMKNWVNAVKNI